MTDTIVPRIHWSDGVSRPVATPLHMSVVYASASPDELDDQYEGRAAGHTYSREGHPNAVVLAERIAELEGAPNPGWVTGSGMAALSAVMLALGGKGARVVGGDQLYGRTRRMMAEDLPRFGFDTTLADPTDAGAFADAIGDDARIVLIEAVSNPTLRVAEVSAIVRAAKSAGAIVVVDNTFTTPAGFRPFEYGADVVVHSVTKLLAGHSDAMLGWVCAKDAELQKRIETLSVTLGLTPSPFDCWLAERGLHSFALRQAQAERSAGRLADRLADLRGVTRVIYPGRADHPDRAAAEALLLGPGNMLSFEVEGGRAAANRLTEAMTGLPFAPTLGDVATTLSHPASSSHRGLSAAAREAIGITEGFFRVSVGIEPPERLVAAFEAGVAASQAG